MDPSSIRIFQGRYFHINRKLLMCLGLWPYVTKYKMYILWIIVIGTLAVLSVPQLVDVILHTENVDRQMMGIISFLTIWLMIFKIIGMILAQENMKAMHRSIANNWQLIQDEEERDLLHKYAEFARFGTIFYLAGLMGSAAIGLLLPCIPKILDIIIPSEYLRPSIYLVEGEYFIDKEAHFTLFFFLNYFGIMFICFVSATFETMYIVSVEHCCTLYAIIRSRLLALRQIAQNSSSTTKDCDSYEWLLSTIRLHQHALTFTSLLDDSYSMAFLFILITGLFVLPLGCCAVISHLHNPLHLIPYGIYSVAALVQGFFIFYPGQRIIDHQLSLCDAAYCNEWYEIPLRTRKLLIIFMVRCSKPVIISAGGLFPMNFELYFKIVKTAVSYTTVAWSFR